MQYVIFPMKTISISQGYHDAHKAWDLNGEDTGIDYWYAPCRVKVSALFPYDKTGFYNTVIFTSCDENGNPTPVLMANGTSDILSFSCTHMNSVDKFGLAVGKIYEAGERCYCEGNTGLGSTGNHVHMGVSKGVQTKIIKYSDGKWYMPDIMDPDDVFHQFEGFNVEGNHGAKGYTFKSVTSREAEVCSKLNFGMNFVEIKGVPAYLYKINPEKVELYQEASMPLRTGKKLKDVLPEGKRLTTSHNEERVVPSWLGIKDKKTGKPFFVHPYNYFNNTKSSTDYLQIYGRIQGVNIDEAPDQEGYLDYVVTPDYQLKQGNDESQMASWELRGNEALVGGSSALVLHRDGIARKLYSSAVGWGKYTISNTQTVLAHDGEGIIIGTVDGDILPITVDSWLFERGCTQIEFGDSGGSACCHYDTYNDPLSAEYVQAEQELLPEEPEIVPEPEIPEKEETSVPNENTPEESQEPTEEVYSGLGKLLYEFIMGVINLLFNKQKGE